MACWVISAFANATFRQRGKIFPSAPHSRNEPTPLMWGRLSPISLYRRLTGSGRLYHITRDYKTERGYTETESGGTVAASYYLGENLSHTLRYTLYSSETKFTSGLFTSTRRYLQEERGNLLHSIIGNELRYDTRDSYYNPTEGLSLTGYFDYSGAWGRCGLLLAYKQSTGFTTLWCHCGLAALPLEQATLRA